MGACHSEKKSAWNKPWAGAEKGQPGNRLKAWSEQKIWTENRSLVCIRRWIFVIIWCWGQKVFCPQLMPTNCSAARQLTQFYKHSKSADLLRKSLLSTLRFGRCKTNIHWMFCTSCLAGPKFKSLIVQARTAFWAFDPGIIIFKNKKILTEFIHCCIV